MKRREQFINFLGFFCVFGLFQLAHAAPICTVNYSMIGPGENQARMDLQLNDYHISLIGWEHQISRQEDSLRKATSDALIAAQNGKCSTVDSLLKNVMIQNPDRELNSRFVLQQLSEVQRQFSIDAIGDEYSPEEIQIRENFRKQIESDLSSISLACPNLQNTLSRFRSVYPGPIYAFNHLKPNPVPVIGVEELAIREKAHKYLKIRYAVLEQMNTQGEPSDVPKKSWDLINQILQNSKDNGYLDEKSLAQALNLISKPDIKKLIESFVRATSGLYETMYERNNFIVKKLTQHPGNYVLVFGGYHLNDLVNKLLQACNSGQFASVPQTSQSESVDSSHTTQ